jgi:hypothetical protein
VARDDGPIQGRTTSTARHRSVLVLAGLLVIPAPASAVHPAKGKTYSGEIKQSVTVQFPISFKVSSTGKSVSKFRLPNGYPVYCQGGGFGSAHSRRAKISRRGTFRAKLPIIFAPTHQHQGFLKVTGKFRSHKRETGKVVTGFTNGSSCGGSSKYSTRAH